ncbi:two-component system, OmpR family, phosphate regulon sensor histidine kinase PhoR [Thermotomaculum hydrothermale]|uniref:histidine kinase n=1 Tax=Thermotomaculum hydrothermale TaxID=981385 RepID=A0A7R6T031_9BACT|nr:ATP-binding protein [Thermotomaculum hydrothermale]BBB33375.1 two-component system, OmpR family, phosphate regulon sensor histidine kinase PhoR [Thermotomaculum hydrothermale]
MAISLKGNKIFKKILFFVAILLFVFSLFSIAVNYTVFKSIYIKVLINDLKNDALIYSKEVVSYLKNKDFKGLDREVKRIGKKTGLRITVILLDGKVVADSNYNPLKMENHKNRPEVIDSLKGGFGYSIRFSHTLKKKLLYVAMPLKSNGESLGFIRISTFLTGIEKTLTLFSKTIIFITLVLFLISSLILFFYFKSLFKPLDRMLEAINNVKDGNLDVEVYVKSDDEFAVIANGFNNMVNALKRDVSIIEQEKNRLKVLTNSLNEAVVLLDREGRILFSNNRFSKVFNVNEISGKFIWEVIRDNDFVSFVKNLEHSGKKSFKLKINNYYFDVSASFLEESGEILLTFYDLTEKVKLQKMKKDFVANATHELKTPITILKGFVETMKNDGVDSPYLPLIESNIERMARLINDLLILSRLEDSKVKKIEREETDICQLVNSIALLFKKKAESKNLELKVMCQENLFFHIDRFTFEQLLINLVDNAVRYTEKGYVEVLCKIENSRLLVSVKDTGIGISEDKLGRIFERFYVVDKSRSKKSGGTGLGLSIVKHIVELYSGEIIVESRLNKGSVFKVYIS